MQHIAYTKLLTTYLDPRSIPAISVEIRSIRVIRVLFLFTNKFLYAPSIEINVEIWVVLCYNLGRDTERI